MFTGHEGQGINRLSSAPDGTVASGCGILEPVLCRSWQKREDAVLLYSQCAKLLRFRHLEFEKRRLGDVLLLMQKNTGVVRVPLQDEKMLTILS